MLRILPRELPACIAPQQWQMYLKIKEKQDTIRYSPTRQRFYLQKPCWHERRQTINLDRIYWQSQAGVAGDNEATAKAPACRTACSRHASILRPKIQDDSYIELAKEPKLPVEWRKKYYRIFWGIITETTKCMMHRHNKIGTQKRWSDHQHR